MGVQAVHAGEPVRVSVVYGVLGVEGRVQEEKGKKSGVDNRGGIIGWVDVRQVHAQKRRSRRQVLGLRRREADCSSEEEEKDQVGK